MISEIFNFLTPEDFRDVNESYDPIIVILFSRLLAWIIENALYILPILTLVAFVIGLYRDPWPDITKKIFNKEGLITLSEEEYNEFVKQ